MTSTHTITLYLYVLKPISLRLLLGGYTRSKRIALITDDFTIFQSILEVTKFRRIDTLVLSFSDPIPPDIGSVITSASESGRINFNPEKIVTFSEDAESTVNAALQILNGKNGKGQIIIGIDPGKTPGVAVLEDDMVIAIYHIPSREVLGVVRQILENYPPENSIIRIGHGARLVSAQLSNSLLDLGVRVELVDETGTTPAMGRGIHGPEISDIIAAINIARLKGIPPGIQDLEPSIGEIKRIQEMSRELSHGKASIPRDLARKVAKDELTLEEAIRMHECASPD